MNRGSHRRREFSDVWRRAHVISILSSEGSMTRLFNAVRLGQTDE
jgi:hypothetical protein